MDYKTEKLVRLAGEHDPDAFTSLMDLQIQGMYKIARSILQNDEDAADAIQDTILTCWEKIETLKEIRYFKTWLTRILINHCYDQLNQSHKVTYVDEYPEMAAPSQAGNLEWQGALAILSAENRLIVTLFYAQGFKTKEIAKILQLSDATVRTRLSRARAQLEKYYKE